MEVVKQPVVQPKLVEPKVEEGGLDPTLDSSPPPKRTLAEAIASEINKLDTPKKQDTALLIVSRRIVGQGFDTKEFWAMEATCARSTYQKWRQDDPAFVQVLNDAYELARTWRNKQTTSRVAEAVTILQYSAEEAAHRLVELMMNSPNDHVALRAAREILDRAATTTASKTPNAVVVTHDDFEVAADELEEWRARRRQLPAGDDDHNNDE